MSDSTPLKRTEMGPRNNAIIFRDVWKSYGHNGGAFTVLKGLNLTVAQGTIYGLLGPSGCGKTTLLRCVVGRENINDGTVLVFGEPPGIIKNKNLIPRIGYMPQDIALNHRLTVNETLHFYGALTGLDKTRLRERCEFLLAFLGISNANTKFVGHLSGGQQRRASLAVAMLHEPELLILDEPTVGVDPVLRQSIWEYLNELITINHSTIIITTHYIEEAGLAHNVGLMLNGKLLAEGPPNLLMQQHGCMTLENTFLKLCHDFNDEDDNDYQNETKKQDHDESDKESVQLKNQSKNLCCARNQPKSRRGKFLQLPSWKRIQAYFIKDFFFLLRHKGLLVFEIFLPPAIILCFAICVGKSLFGIPLGVVNTDTKNLGELFLSSIDERTIIQVPFSNYEDAEKEALLGTIIGVVYIKSNFSDAIEQRFKNGLITGDAAFDASLIGISLDLTSQQSAFTISSELLYAFRRFAHNTLTKLGLNPMSADIPIKFEEKQVYGSLEDAFDQFLVPGFMLCATFFMAMGLTAISLITERYSGNLERGVISGGLIIEWMLGHVLAQFILMLAQIFFMFVVTFVIFGFKCEGSYVLAALLTIFQGLCGMHFGLLLSSVFNNETTTIMTGVGAWFFAIASEGFLWPVQGMPYIIRFISFLLPQTYAVEGLRSIMNRGWGLGHSQITAAFSTTFVWLALFLIAAWATSRSKL